MVANGQEQKQKTRSKSPEVSVNQPISRCATSNSPVTRNASKRQLPGDTAKQPDIPSKNPEPDKSAVDTGRITSRGTPVKAVNKILSRGGSPVTRSRSGVLTPVLSPNTKGASVNTKSSPVTILKSESPRSSRKLAKDNLVPENTTLLDQKKTRTSSRAKDRTSTDCQDSPDAPCTGTSASPYSVRKLSRIHSDDKCASNQRIYKNSIGRKELKSLFSTSDIIVMNQNSERNRNKTEASKEARAPEDNGGQIDETKKLGSKVPSDSPQPGNLAKPTEKPKQESTNTCAERKVGGMADKLSQLIANVTNRVQHAECSDTNDTESDDSIDESSEESSETEESFSDPTETTHSGKNITGSKLADEDGELDASQGPSKDGFHINPGSGLNQTDIEDVKNLETAQPQSELALKLNQLIAKVSTRVKDNTEDPEVISSECSKESSEDSTEDESWDDDDDEDDDDEDEETHLSDQNEVPSDQISNENSNIEQDELELQDTILKTMTENSVLLGSDVTETVEVPPSPSIAAENNSVMLTTPTVSGISVNKEQTSEETGLELVSEQDNGSDNQKDDDVSLEDKIRQLLKTRKRALRAKWEQRNSSDGQLISKEDTSGSDFDALATFEKKSVTSGSEAKQSAFESTELEKYLETNKELDISTEYLDPAGCDADVDRIDGLQLVSFSSKENLDLYLTLRTEGEENMLLTPGGYDTTNPESEGSPKSAASPSKKKFIGGLSSLKQKNFKFGIDGNVSKYLKKHHEVRSGIKKVTGYLQKSEGSDCSSPSRVPYPSSPTKSPTKTNNITEIKGWKKKFPSALPESSSDELQTQACIPVQSSCDADPPREDSSNQDTGSFIRIMRYTDIMNLGLCTRGQQCGFLTSHTSLENLSENTSSEQIPAEEQYKTLYRKDTVGTLDEANQPSKGKIYGRRNDGKFATKVAIIEVKKQKRPFKSYKKKRIDRLWTPNKPNYQVKPAKKKPMPLRPVLLTKRMVSAALTALDSKLPHPVPSDIMTKYLTEKTQCDKPGVAKHTKKYTLDDLQGAVQSVKCHQSSFRQASRTFGVPSSTIKDHVTERYTMKPPGPSRSVIDDQEAAVASYIRYTVDQGFSPRRSDIRILLRELIRKTGHPCNFNMESGPSDRWFRGFMERHPDLAEKIAPEKDSARSSMWNELIVDDCPSLHSCKFGCQCNRSDTPTLPQYIQDYTPPLEDTDETQYPELPDAVDLNATCHKVHCRLGCVCDSLDNSEAKDVVDKIHCGRADCIFECNCEKQLRSTTRCLRNLWEGRGLPPDSRSQSPVIMFSQPRSLPGVIKPLPIKPSPTTTKEGARDAAGTSTAANLVANKSNSASSVRKSSRIKDRPNFANIDKMNSLIYYDPSLWLTDDKSKSSKVHAPGTSGNKGKSHKSHNAQACTKQSTQNYSAAYSYHGLQTKQEVVSPPSKSPKSLDAEMKHMLEVQFDLDLNNVKDTESASCARHRVYVPARLKHKQGGILPTGSKRNSEPMPVVSSVFTIQQREVYDDVPYDDSCEIVDMEPPKSKKVKLSTSSGEPSEEPVKEQMSQNLTEETPKIPSSSGKQKKISTQMVLLQKKSKSKDKKTEPILLEIKSDCNWSSVRTKLLSKTSTIIAKGSQYPYRDHYVDNFHICQTRNESTVPVKIPAHMMTPALKCTEMVPLHFFVSLKNPPQEISEISSSANDDDKNHDETKIDMKSEEMKTTQPSCSENSEEKHDVSNNGSGAPSCGNSSEKTGNKSNLNLGTKTFSRDGASESGVSSFNHFKISTNTLVKSGSGSLVPSSSVTNQLEINSSKITDEQSLMKKMLINDMPFTKCHVQHSPSQQESNPNFETKHTGDMKDKGKTQTRTASEETMNKTDRNINTPQDKKLAFVTHDPVNNPLRLVYKQGNTIYELPDSAEKLSSVSPSTLSSFRDKAKQPMVKKLKLAEGNGIGEKTSPGRVIKGKDGIWRVEETGSGDKPKTENSESAESATPNTSQIAKPLLSACKSVPFSTETQAGVPLSKSAAQERNGLEMPVSMEINRSEMPVSLERNGSEMPVLIPQETNNKRTASDERSGRSSESPPTLEPVVTLNNSLKATSSLACSLPEPSADTQIQESLSMLESLEAAPNLTAASAIEKDCPSLEPFASVEEKCMLFRKDSSEQGETSTDHQTNMENESTSLPKLCELLPSKSPEQVKKLKLSKKTSRNLLTNTINNNNLVALSSSPSDVTNVTNSITLPLVSFRNQCPTNPASKTGSVPMVVLPNPHVSSGTQLMIQPPASTVSSNTATQPLVTLSGGLSPTNAQKPMYALVADNKLSGAKNIGAGAKQKVGNVKTNTGSSQSLFLVPVTALKHLMKPGASKDAISISSNLNITEVLTKPVSTAAVTTDTKMSNPVSSQVQGFPGNVISLNSPLLGNQQFSLLKNQVSPVMCVQNQMTQPTHQVTLVDDNTKPVSSSSSDGKSAKSELEKMLRGKRKRTGPRGDKKEQEPDGQKPMTSQGDETGFGMELTDDMQNAGNLVTHYKIAGSQLFKKGELSEIQSTHDKDDESCAVNINHSILDPKCPVHGKSSSKSVTNISLQSQTLASSKNKSSGLGYVYNGVFKPLSETDIKDMGLGDVNFIGQDGKLNKNVVTGGKNKIDMCTEKIVFPGSSNPAEKSVIVDTDMKKAGASDFLDDIKADASKVDNLPVPIVIPDSPQPESLPEPSTSSLEDFKPKQVPYAPPKLPPHFIDCDSLSSQSFLSDDNSQMSDYSNQFDDVDILEVDDGEMPAAFKLKNTLLRDGTRTSSEEQYKENVPNKKKRKQLHSDRNMITEGLDLVFEEGESDDPLDPNRPTTPELREGCGDDRIVYKCNRERRRRHDMTYKFQLLQSLLYPNAEKMSKQFILDAATKTIQALGKEHEELTKERDYVTQRRDWLVTKIKALKESEKNKYAAITVNEETGSRVVISDPIVNKLESPKKSPRCRKASSRYQDYLVPTGRSSYAQHAQKIPQKRPLTASEKLFKNKSKPVIEENSSVPKKQNSSGPKTAEEGPTMSASRLLGTMADDVLRSIRQQESVADSAANALKDSPSGVIATKTKSVTLEQLEKQEVVLTKCEKCNERIAFSSRFVMDVKCPGCGFLILQNESDPNTAVPDTPKNSKSTGSDSAKRACADSEQDTAKSEHSEAKTAAKITVSSGDVLDIFKDGVKGYVDSVGEDEVIVIVKDEDKANGTDGTSEPQSSLLSPTLDSNNSDSESEKPSNKVRKKLGF